MIENAKQQIKDVLADHCDICTEKADKIANDVVSILGLKVDEYVPWCMGVKITFDGKLKACDLPHDHEGDHVDGGYTWPRMGEGPQQATRVRLVTDWEER